MAASALHHAGNHQTGHGQEGFHIGIDDRIPFVQVSFVLLVYPDDQSCVVDQHIDIFPLGRQTVQSSRGGCAVAHIEGQEVSLRAVVGFQRGFHCHEAFEVAAVEDDAVAVAGKDARTAFPDTGGGSRDQNRFRIHGFSVFCLHFDGCFSLSHPRGARNPFYPSRRTKGCGAA